MQHDNPLLKLDGLPKFGEILPEHIEPAVDYMLARNREQVEELLSSEDSPEWDNFVAPLERIEDELERVWAPVSHLNGVRDNDALRAVYEKCLPKLSDYSAEMGQNRGIYEAIRQIRDSEEFDRLDQARRKVIENALRDFHLAGVDLDPGSQDRYREITSELSRLGNVYSRNLLDATDNWNLDVTEPERLSGLPDSAVMQAKNVADDAGIEGWRFSLQYPAYLAVMTYSNDRGLREEMYRAFVTRASEIGPNAGRWDNGDVMMSILRLRKELAELLGYRDYAEYSLATKMAQNSEEVFEFISQLKDKCRELGKQEVLRLQEFAGDELGLRELAPWDFVWASEKLRDHLYSYSQESLRPYFPLPRVLAGMFAIVGRLFGISVESEDPPQTWHPDVEFFRIGDENGDTRGYFYLDLYARKQKRGGAWMADCVGRRRTEHGIQLPVAFLTCNFSPPVGGKPSLLTHDDVITLFHEFGHGLHHLLTRIEVASVAGINGVPWDAVELPSQFLENWCWEREALDLISGHVDNGQPLPQDMLDKMRMGRNFHSALQFCRQLEFSLFDMRLHTAFDPSGEVSIQQLLDGVRKEVSVVPVADFNRFQNSFGHIFAGGYAAGYYSYQWAEVLSADAFSLFEENGILDVDTGRRFLSRLLEMGGADEPMVLFEAFRGRKPTVDALLRHSGLSPLDEAA